MKITLFIGPLVCYTIGMHNHNVLFLSIPFAPQRSQGIYRLAGKCGWTLRIASTDAPPTDWQGDGALVILDGSAKTRAFVEDLRRRNIPVVDLREDCPEVDIPRVSGDDHEIGRLAARHFLERGFRHAAFFSTLENFSHAERLAGFTSEWTRETPDVWLWPRACGKRKRVDDLASLRKWLGEKLKAGPHPLAVFAWNDADAVHVLQACATMGLRVPDEVAVLGVDNQPMVCEQQPVKLSSVAHDLVRIGYTGAALLERLMNGGKPDRTPFRIRPRGVVTRESTGPVARYQRELAQALDYIHGHLSVPFGAQDIAEALNMSRGRLDRLFTARLHHSVGQEIANQRLARAQDLLRNTNDSVADISQACGYCNPSFFIKCFLSATNTTPHAWRKEGR